MKQCISRIISFIIHLWQTLKEYVCEKKILRKSDVDNDGKDEIVIDLNGCPDKSQRQSDSEVQHDR